MIRMTEKSGRTAVPLLAPLLVGVTILAATASVRADGTADLLANGERYRVEFTGKQVRIESTERRGLYMLAHDESLYAVSQVQGRPLVMEGRAIINLLAAAGAGAATRNHPDDLVRFGELRRTSRRETVAGIHGEVYTLEFWTRKGEHRTVDIVLSSDPDIVQLTGAMGNIALALQQTLGTDTQGAQELIHALQQRGLGVLRAGPDIRLVGIDRATPPPDRFRLPAQPVALPDLRSLLPGLRR